MKYFTLSSKKMFLMLFIMVFTGTLNAQNLKVSDNKRYLVKADGKPFFYLGDTAWELFHRLNREQAEVYLKNRADKGFTVIQAVVLAELDGLTDPNPYGQIPLLNQDPATPNEAYFNHVDYIVNKAAELGLYIGMLPTWGDKVINSRSNSSQALFNDKNAKIYGQYIGTRYKNKSNIIWILGGDRNPGNSQDIEVWRALADGILMGAGKGNQNKALMTYHPAPKDKGGSSTWFQEDDWLDFNMFQTGHCRNSNIYDQISHDYQLPTIKPTMDGEPIYEDHPVCFRANDLGYSAAYDVRRAAYLDLFAGAHGHTYGCHAVWQMYAPKRNPINGPLKPWYESLDLPGASDMSHVRALIESRPMLTRIPDQSLIKSETFSEGNRIQATRGEGYLFIYTTSGKSFTVNMGKISGKQLKGYWYDPHEGTSKSIEEFENTGTRKFIPPSAGLGNDWVLILDDSSKGYQEPKRTW